MIPPAVFLAVVFGALVGACVVLVMDTQGRGRAMLWGVVAGLVAGVVTYLLFLR